MTYEPEKRKIRIEIDCPLDKKKLPASRCNDCPFHYDHGGDLNDVWCRYNILDVNSAKVRLLLRSGIADSEGRLAEYRYTSCVIELPNELLKDHPEVIGMEYLA